MIALFESFCCSNFICHLSSLFSLGITPVWITPFIAQIAFILVRLTRIENDLLILCVDCSIMSSFTPYA